MSSYGINAGHLKPNPTLSEHFLGPRKGWADAIVKDIRNTIQSGKAPKSVIYGALGLGKTHLVNYIRKQLNDISVGVYVECPPFHRRTKFHELHSRLMSKFGRIYFNELLKKCVNEFEDAREIANSFNIDTDLAYIILNGYEKDTQLLWRYITGEKIRASEMQLIDAITPQLKEQDMAMLLDFVGKLVQKYENKQLLFIIDEMEHTNPLIGDSMVVFRETMRSIVDENNSCGFIFTASVREDKDFRIVSDDAVRSRIGILNFKKFEEYNKSDLINLIKNLIIESRSTEFQLSEPLNAAKTSTTENVTEETFPFTTDAIENIVDFVLKLRQNGNIESIRPREALQIMDKALAMSSEEKLAVIDSSVVKKIEDDMQKVFETESLDF